MARFIAGNFRRYPPHGGTISWPAKWETIRMLRLAVTGAIEIARAEKEIGSSLEAAPRVYLSYPEHLKVLKRVDFAEICITSDIEIEFGTPMPENCL